MFASGACTGLCSQAGEWPRQRSVHKILSATLRTGLLLQTLTTSSRAPDADSDSARQDVVACSSTLHLPRAPEPTHASAESEPSWTVSGGGGGMEAGRSPRLWNTRSTSSSPVSKASWHLDQPSSQRKLRAPRRVRGPYQKDKEGGLRGGVGSWQAFKEGELRVLPGLSRGVAIRACPATHAPSQGSVQPWSASGQARVCFQRRRERKQELWNECGRPSASHHSGAETDQIKVEVRHITSRWR